MSLEVNGCITKEELASVNQLVSEERFQKGPVAVIECIQKIPCNPCESACVRKAIHIGEPITSLPALNEDLCTGCGICISKCPGLAIFVVDKTFSDTEAAISFPYEYTPTPKKDETIDAVDREGRIVCKGRVIKVLNPESFDRTPVVTLAVPTDYADQVRSMRRK